MNRNELINYIILNSKISLGEIAQNIGINRSNIYLWRTKKTKPKIEYVNKMANLAGITLKWINRYHPDSYERLHNINWQNTKSDYQHISWKHMMWKNKNGQYLCFNIEMHYDRKAENVSTLFYHINGSEV